MAAWIESLDDEIRDDRGDVGGVVGAVGAEPVGGPIESAETGAGGDVGIGGGERALLDAVGNQRADAAFVAVPFGDDERPQAAGEGVDFEVGRRSLDLVEQVEDVRLGEASQPVGQRVRRPPRRGQRRQQVIQRPVLTK